MKWLLIVLGALLGLVVLCVIGLLLMGLRPGAGRSVHSVIVARPAADVWTWITEPERVKRWVSWLVEIRTTETGPPRAGMTEVWVMDDPNMKRRIEIEGRITEVTPLQRLSVAIAMPGQFEGTTTYTLTEVEGGTRLDTDGRFLYTHPLIRLLEPIVTPEADKKMRADLARLKSLAEAAPPAAAIADSVSAVP